MIIPPDFLGAIMPFVLIFIVGFFLFKHDINDESRAQILSVKTVGFLILPLIAVFDGFFGPGASALYMISLVSLAGLGIVNATARVKLYNFSSNMGGLLAYVFVGAIYWKIGLLMALGQTIGSFIGARIAMSGGCKNYQTIAHCCLHHHGNQTDLLVKLQSSSECWHGCCQMFDKSFDARGTNNSWVDQGNDVRIRQSPLRKNFDQVSVFQIF